MIRVVHPGSGSWLFTHFGSGFKKAPVPRSQIGNRNADSRIFSHKKHDWFYFE